MSKEQAQANREIIIYRTIHEYQSPAKANFFSNSGFMNGDKRAYTKSLDIFFVLDGLYETNQQKCCALMAAHAVYAENTELFNVVSDMYDTERSNFDLLTTDELCDLYAQNPDMFEALYSSLDYQNATVLSSQDKFSHFTSPELLHVCQKHPGLFGILFRSYDEEYYPFGGDKYDIIFKHFNSSYDIYQSVPAKCVEKLYDLKHINAFDYQGCRDKLGGLFCAFKNEHLSVALGDLMLA